MDTKQLQKIAKLYCQSIVVGNRIFVFENEYNISIFDFDENEQIANYQYAKDFIDGEQIDCKTIDEFKNFIDKNTDKKIDIFDYNKFDQLIDDICKNYDGKIDGKYIVIESKINDKIFSFRIYNKQSKTPLIVCRIYDNFIDFKNDKPIDIMENLIENYRDYEMIVDQTINIE